MKTTADTPAKLSGETWHHTNTVQESILVVDDELSVARTYHTFLQREGFGVDIANTNKEAITLLQHKKYETVLTDILIDRDSGFDLLQYCQTHCPDTPTILITGLPSTESAVSALRLGAFDYLRKPVAHEKLLLTIQAAVKECHQRRQTRAYAEEISMYRHNLEEIVGQRTKALAANKEFLESILEALPHSFCVIDVQSKKVVLANAAAQVSGETSGMPCYTLLHGRQSPCSPEDYLCPIEEICRLGSPVLMEHDHLDATGNTRRMEIHAYPIKDSQGAISQIIQYKIDVTERRQLETIAESASLMENLGYIFAGIRHEIGNPINSIKVSLTVLQKKLAGYSRETIAEFVSRTLAEVARVENLLQSFKNFSLHEKAKMTKVDMNEFLGTFMDLAHSELGKRGVRLRYEQNQGPHYIVADLTFLQQVFLNLTTNAAQAMEHLDAPEILLKLYREPGRIVVSVSDSGIGMSKEDCRRAFMPFFTTKARGTGLGLVIVRKILLKMNGTIHLSSTPGQGTVATVRLPAYERTMP